MRGLDGEWDSEDLEDEDEDEDEEEDFEEFEPPVDREEPKWMREQRELARKVAEGGDRYESIEQMETHEAYRFMRDFIGQVDHPELRDRLHRAISGRGAFRYFKDTLADHGLLDRWFAYEHQRQLEYACEWLESVGIEPV